MPRPTNAELFAELKDLRQLVDTQTETIATLHALADRAHQRLDKAGTVFVAMRDAVDEKLVAIEEGLRYGDLVPS